MKRGFRILITFYLFQIFITACSQSDDGDTCTGGSPKSFEVIYNDLDIKAIERNDTSLQSKQTIQREAFNLALELSFESSEIDSSNKTTFIDLFKMESILACSPIPDQYIQKDPISNITIFQADLTNNKKVDITKGFQVSIDLLDEKYSIQQFLEERKNIFGYSLLDLLIIEPIDANTILDNYIFEVIITLESGVQISSQTQEITFI